MNYILSMLQTQDRELLMETGRLISFDGGQALCKAYDPVDEVFFPTSGVISAVIDLKDGAQVETALIGCRGALGSGVVFGQKYHIAGGVGRLRGEAWAVQAPTLRDLSARNAPLREALLRYQQYILAQVQQTAACSTRHVLRQRLASWLLRAQHTAESDQVFITQDAIGLVLGVQRASISGTASELAEAGAIEYRRGQISIVNAHVLRQCACECHEAVAEWRRRLLSPSDGGAHHSTGDQAPLGRLPSTTDQGDLPGPVSGLCAPDR